MFYRGKYNNDLRCKANFYEVIRNFLVSYTERFCKAIQKYFFKLLSRYQDYITQNYQPLMLQGKLL
jgi:hypothetical protein